MNSQQKQDFDLFMAQLKETNATLDFFCDFEKIAANVERIAIKLAQLNYLIGQDDMEAAIKRLWNENPKVFTVLDILIAVRKSDKKKVINSANETQLIEHYFDSAAQVVTFIRETGLEKVFSSKQISNLTDYVFGVETGLDTNARKNRSGHLMENHIAAILRSQAIPFEQEVFSTRYPALSVLGEDKKRFDFVVETPVKTYLMEVNFYSAGGSKLNEVARSYSELAPKINVVPGFEFVWITDGQGWLSARNKLEEALAVIPSTYNLTTIRQLIDNIKRDLHVPHAT